MHKKHQTMNRHVKYLHGMPVLDTHAYLSDYPAIEKADFIKRLNQPFESISDNNVMSFQLDGLELYPVFQLDDKGQVYPIIEDLIYLLYRTMSPVLAYTCLCENYEQLGSSIADCLNDEGLHIKILGIVDSISRPKK